MRLPSTTILCALLAFALFFSGLGAIGLIGPDEPRYAQVAREMQRSGDYITPRLFGAAWFEKPPLYYWLAALSFQAGVNEVTARLPSATFAVAFLGVWYWFARRRFEQRTAILGCLLLASTPGWIGFGRAAAMDMLLSTTLGAALVFLALWFWEEKRKFLYGFSILLGVATLAKGPLAVGLAGLVMLAYAATFREWRTLKPMLWSWCPVLFAAVALPWYVLCYAHNGYPFIQEFIIRHNWERLVSAQELGHGQPFWFYVPILAAGIFPWTPLLVLPVAQMVGGGLRQILGNRQRAFLFYWTTLPFAFFSFSENKLPGYLLPILPPLTLWIASLLEEGPPAKVSGDRERGGSLQPARSLTVAARIAASNDREQYGFVQRAAPWLVSLAALLLLSLPPLLGILPESLATGLRQALAAFQPDSPLTRDQMGSLDPDMQMFGGEVHWGVWVTLAGLVVVSIYLVIQKRLLDACLAILLGVALTTLAITQFLAPSITRIASMQRYAGRIEQLGVPIERLGVQSIHRNQVFGLSFYFDRKLPEWSPDGGPANVSFVITKAEVYLEGARSLILFPAPGLRVWELERQEGESRAP